MYHKCVDKFVSNLVRRALSSQSLKSVLNLFQNLVEKVVYKVNEDNTNLTVAERSAWVESKLFGLSRAIEAFGIDRFRKNSVKAVSGFNHVLNNLFANPSMAMQHEGPVSTTMNKTEKLMGAAKKATNLAKSKAETIYASASYQP